MKRTALLAFLITLTAAPSIVNAQTDESVIITTNDQHDYVAPDRQLLEFRNKEFIFEIYYNNSSRLELSKIAVTCFGRRKSFAYDHTYFVARVSPLVDLRHDEKGRVTAAYFEVEMRTERSLKEPDRVVYIECADGKIETSIIGEAVVP